MPKRLNNLLVSAIFAFALLGSQSGCGGTTVVTPTAVVSTDFVVRWNIAFASTGMLTTCIAAHTPRMGFTIVNVATGVTIQDNLDCEPHVGLSSAVAETGTYHVSVQLFGPTGAVVTKIDFPDQVVTTSGTVDLGTVTFQVP